MDNRSYQFASNIAMGMTQVAAARASGFNAQAGMGLMKDPSIQQEIVSETRRIQGEMIFSRNDVLAGLKSAIDDAVLMGDPTPQIAGWREIGRIVGVYAPEEKKITYEGDVTVIQKRVKELADEKLHEYALIEGEVVPEPQVLDQVVPEPQVLDQVVPEPQVLDQTGLEPLDQAVPGLEPLESGQTG